MDTMGKRIGLLMQVKGYTHSDLARECGAKRASVNQWVHDQSQPMPANLLNLCDALGADPHFVVFGKAKGRK